MVARPAVSEGGEESDEDEKSESGDGSRCRREWRWCCDVEWMSLMVGEMIGFGVFQRRNGDQCVTAR